MPARSKSGARKKTPAARPERKSQVQVISRAMAIMRCLENESEGLSLSSLSQRLKLARSTVQRIVNALEAESVLIAASPTARVRLGPALVRLAASVETSAERIAKPLMVELAKELGETIDLSVLAKDHAVFIERVIGSHSVYAIAPIAAQYPLHCTANGRAMLAMLSDEEVEQRIGRSYERRTPNSITTLKDLTTALRSVRRAGVAFSNEENAIGICGIGVAFRDAHDNVLSLSVPVPTSRFEQQKKTIAQRLLETKALLQKQLGGHEAQGAVG